MPRRPLVAAGLLAALIATRWTLAPKYLFYIDNINFARAVQEFNPMLHQPHPPGYPLFVALLKLLAVFVPSATYVQLVAGTIGSLLALLLIHQLGEEMFGPSAGWLAAALLFFQPSFWLAGIGNYVRTFLAAGATAVALMVWRAWKRPETSRWLYWSAAALGIAAGFRQELLLLLFPLLCSVFFRTGWKPVTMLKALAVLGVVSLPWLGAILWKTGGPAGLWTLYAGQFESARSASLLWGASLHENLRTAVLAGYWTGVGVLSWVWALPFLRGRMRLDEVREQLTLLAWWFVPPLLFHSLVFVHDPDATLVSIPVTALAGGWCLSRLLQERLGAGSLLQPSVARSGDEASRILVRHNPPARMPALHAEAGATCGLVAILGMAINTAVFFASPLQQRKDASFAWVKRVGIESTEAIDGIRALSVGHATLVVMNRPLVTPQQISYYLPKQPFVFLDADLRRGCPNQQARFELPPASRFIWLPPLDGSLPAPPLFRKERKLDYVDVGPGTAIQVGGCELVVAGVRP